MGLSIVLLAAGEGKRMKTNLPKPLVKLGDHPMIQHILNTSKELKPEKIIVVTGYKKDEVKKYLIDNNQENFIFCEQKERLGTGHAVKQATPYIPDKGKTLILYSDVPIVSKLTLKRLLRVSARKKLSILTAVMENPLGYGRIIRNMKKQPLLIREQADATKEEKRIKEIFSGIMIVENGHLKRGVNSFVRNNVKGEYYLTDLVQYTSARNSKIGSVLADHKEVMGANTKAELSNLYKALNKLNFDRLTNKGVFFKDQETCYIEGDLRTGRDVTIGQNVVFKGKVTLGDNVTIGSNVSISDTKISKNSEIKDFCSIESTKILKNVIVGPFARLRDGVVLGENAKIGNFVEIKNSNLGAGTKANHHTYLGDASLGKKVNIGAGTITCNYDGEKKHKTKVGDDVFVGSNSSLIAPIAIGKKAYIAAGSAITSNVPSGSLAFGRSKQSTKKNWKKK